MPNPLLLDSVKNGGITAATHPFIQMVKDLIIKCKQDIQDKTVYLSNECTELNGKIAVLRQRYKIALEDNSPEALAKLFRCAAVEGELEVLQEYHQNQGVPIDSQDSNPNILRTALHWACFKQHETVIDYLLTQGARFDIEDAQRKLAWEYVTNTSVLALFKASTEVFAKKYRVAASAGIFLDWGKVLRMAVASNYLADVRFLIEVKEIDINSPDSNPQTYYTPLHLAVIKNKPEIAAYLISQGANSNTKDANQKTPIDYIKDDENKSAWYEIFNIPMEEPESECSLKPM